MSDLTKDEILTVLREHVTVVRPGELLIVRVPTDTSDDDLSGLTWTFERALKGLGVRGVVLREHVITRLEVVASE